MFKSQNSKFVSLTVAFTIMEIDQTTFTLSTCSDPTNVPNMVATGWSYVLNFTDIILSQ